MTDNSQPTTEALRSELDWLGNYIGGALPPATSAGEVIERAHRALYAVRDAVAFLEARAESAAKVRARLDTAIGIIETGDQRLLAADGPAGQQPPDLTLAEWRRLYVALTEARAALDSDALAEQWVDSDPPDERGKYCLDCGQFAPRHFDFCRHALDADAPAEPVWFTGAPNEACIGDPSHQYHSHDEDAPEPGSAEPAMQVILTSTNPATKEYLRTGILPGHNHQPPLGPSGVLLPTFPLYRDACPAGCDTARSAEPEGLDAAWAEAEAALPRDCAVHTLQLIRRPDRYRAWQAVGGYQGRYQFSGEGPTPAAALRVLYARLRGEQRHGWTNASPEEWDRANAAVQLTCLCEGEFPIHCGPECRCQIHHSSNSGGAPEIAPDEHLEADYEDRYSDDSGL